jgi:hypothetical protein
MEIVNFGYFTPSADGSIIFYTDEAGNDWYDLRRSLTQWAPDGSFLNAIYGAWATVDADGIVTHVEYDPSRLVPDNRTVLGIDAAPEEIEPGMQFTGTEFIVVPAVPGAEDVVAERERRLALGFDFDFGDERGIHRIGTSPDDMRKWMDEVTPLAQVYLNGGQPGSEITITTETGVAVITANEWQSILIAAAGYRQPLYAASFALQAMDPIPADYATNPAYWP